MQLHLRKTILCAALSITCACSLFAQTATDSSTIEGPIGPKSKLQLPRLTGRSLIVPTVFIAYGFASLKVQKLTDLNHSTKTEIMERNFKPVSIDNYTQYAPVLMVYGLNAAGIKGKHNFKDRTIIYAGARLITASLVSPLKRVVKWERPDGSNTLSFPSGHTANAFASAHFMFKEYKDRNFWLAASGYSFAAFTGVCRTINNKHWVGDVVAGAGFGILSTELSYWLYPKVNKLFAKKGKNSSTAVMPFYQDKAVGLSMVKAF